MTCNECSYQTESIKALRIENSRLKEENSQLLVRNAALVEILREKDPEAGIDKTNQTVLLPEVLEVLRESK